LAWRVLCFGYRRSFVAFFRADALHALQTGMQAEGMVSNSEMTLMVYVKNIANKRMRAVLCV
jgi:hypothetical protein